MKYFSSDIHLNDYSTIINDNRPFKSSKKFDKYIIKLWNKLTSKADTIYIIGDFVDCDGAGHDGWKDSLPLVKQFKSNIILVLGNNEERIIKYFFDNDFEKFRQYCINLGFKEVYKDLIIKINDTEFFLTHKPINYNKNMLNLFGHCHRALGLYRPFGFNIGCDLNHFHPYSEQDISHLMTMKSKYWDKDKSLNMKV